MPHLSLFLIVPIALIRFCTHSNISKMQEKLRSSSMLPQVKRNIETVNLAKHNCHQDHAIHPSVLNIIISRSMAV